MPRRRGAPRCGVGCRGWRGWTEEMRTARHSRTAPLLSRASHRSAALFRRRDQSVPPRLAVPALVSGLYPQSQLFIAGAVPGNGVHIFRHRNAPFLISAAFLPPRKCVPIPCPAHIRQRHSRCPSVPCPGSSPPDTVPPAAGHRRSSLSGDACGWCRCGY